MFCCKRHDPLVSSLQGMGAHQPLGGSNVSGLTEEVGRTEGLSSFTLRRVGYGEGRPDAKLGAHAAGGGV
jgi:hypothetical protein